MIEIETMVDQFRERLLEAVETLNVLGEKIDLTREIVAEAVGRGIIEDMTDNLIMMSILAHARAHPDEDKAFLAENYRDFDGLVPRRALREAGVRYFRRAEECRTWLGSLTPRPRS